MKNDVKALSLDRMRALLNIEYQEEKQQYELATRTQGVEKRRLQGKCWFPLILGKAYYNSLNLYVVELFRPASDEQEHEFEPGKSVTFFTTQGFDEPKFLPLIAQVVFVEQSRCVVALNHPDQLQRLQQAGQIGMQLYFDDTSYQAMFEALDKVQQTGNVHLQHLRALVYGSAKPEFRQLHPIRFPWLNSSQEAAVNQVINAKDIAIVHGPPGTGKTTTLVEAIYETLHREPQVLVCAQSNTAVDWICEKLAERGVSVLRIGNPLRVNDKMLELTYERRFAAHTDYTELWAIRQSIRQGQSQLRKDTSEALRNRLSKLRSRATELEFRIEGDLFAEAKVIASTLIGASHHLLSHRHFSTVFIDEAAQALEPACWVAMLRAERVVFAGDHCQLPPTIKSRDALQGGLGYTLLERLVAKFPQAVQLLNTQYRMHQDIMAFSSFWFYNGQLKAAAEVAYRTLGYDEAPLAWMDTQDLGFREGVQRHSQSRMNKEEAHALLEVLRGLLRNLTLDRVIDEHIDFAIISPYKAQVNYLRGAIKRDTTLKKIRKSIAIDTIDGFQGQERDVVLISLVRANEQGSIGFLSDLRRMNVAMTRARMKLIILGDAATLSTHPFYRLLYEYIDQKEGVTRLIVPD